MRKKFKTTAFVVIMAVMLVFTMMPATMKANAATDGKVVDSSTINKWQNYFTNPEVGTEYAGGVWTDKSVFKSGSDFVDALQSSDEGSFSVRNKLKTAIAENNFMVAMSAIATNKEIIGYSTVPTDTVFVLDLSNSMDTAKSVPDMVNAANDAIENLLTLNRNNRVGVVLYSGNTKTGNANSDTGMVLLEINRYTKNNKGQYITYSGTSSDTTIKIADNLKYANGNKVGSQSKETDGGTYIQNGIYIAMQQFLKADPIVEDGNVQAGENRMPIFVLMSDGAPTVATTSYTGTTQNNNTVMGTSNMGNGTASSTGIAFATQLTSAHAREMVEDHYNTDARFYTLGLNLSGGSNSAYALSVMNPKSSTNNINQLWDQLFANGKVTIDKKEIVRPAANGSNGGREYTDKLERNSQYYVDKYFDANGNEQLESAFGDIVSEIILQSAYYPTYIENGQRNLSGYVSFDDEIGHFMEVKEMEGILLGDKLFTGEVLAKMMTQGEFGNAQTFTTKGWELVESIAERIGVDENVAITLLQNAWRDKQLYYENDNVFSNYISWYESEAGEYLGFCTQEDSEEVKQAAKESGAKYVTKSYIYYGEVDLGETTSTNKAIAGSDMMHVVIKVRTDIETGHQSVLFEIPASLIPLITYNITLDSDSYDTADNITMEMSEATPIRLLFEVGVDDKINKFNLQEIIEAADHNHPVKVNGNETGEYYFYTNVWGYGNDYEHIQPSSHQVTESVFTPSTDNERYYYIEDSVIYQKSGDSYTQYKGSRAPEGDGYYRAYRTFLLTGQQDKAKITYVYEHIGAATLGETDANGNLSNIAKDSSTGEWYVKAGTVRKTVDFYQTKKTGDTLGGPTETLEYSRYTVVTPSKNAREYDINSYQGNNGRVRMTPATGIKLTKKIDDTMAAADGPFEFEIQLTDNKSFTAELTESDMKTTSNLAFNNGKAKVTLEVGETVYITGLPVGGYTIKEILNKGSEYEVKSVTVNDIPEEGITATDSIEQYKLDHVVFTNTETKDGDLIVRKNVVNDIPDVEEKLNDKEFTINVKLTAADGTALAEGTKFDIVKGEEGREVTLDAKGSFNIKLTHNKSVRVKDVPEGTRYIVTEPNLANGFVLASAEADLTGTIVDDEVSRVTVVNDYRPTGAPAITVNMTKTLNIPWPDDVSFDFHLGKLQPNGSWQIVKVGDVEQQGTTTMDSPNLQFTIPSSELNAIGTYYFRIHETNPNTIPGITNDAGRYIKAVVTETDGDGVLEIGELSGNNVTVDNNKTTANVTFNNVYSITEGTAVTIPIEKRIINNTGHPVSLAGYEFELRKGNELVDANGEADGKTVITNAAGEAEIHLSYSPDDFKELDPNKQNSVVLNYTLSEKRGNDKTIKYDETVYAVTVTLRSDDGQLVAETNIDNGPAKTVVFTNEFDPTEATLDLKANKNLTGRTLKDGEFTFKLYNTDADFVVHNNSEVAAVGTNAADGTIKFDADTNKAGLDPIKYSKVGTYYYVIKEDGGNKGGITYSQEEYYVTVIVTYNEAEGKLVATKSIVKPGSGVITGIPVFNNKYDATPVKATISGTKKLDGRDLVYGDFTFQLKNADGEVIKETTNLSAMADQNKEATSTFSFPAIEYAEEGEYKYTVVEKNDGKNGYKYDDAVYNVTVEVTDGGHGKLLADTKITRAGLSGESSTVGSIVFNNEYNPAPTEVNFTANKHMDNRTLKANEFSFSVYSADANFNKIGAAVVTATNKANGQIVFDTDASKTGQQGIKITEAGTYHYVVKENIPESDSKDFDPDVVYDELEYHITVVAWDQGGDLTTKVTQTAGGVEVQQLNFSNIYFEPAPARIDLDVTKNLTGRDLGHEEFTFELYETADTYDISGKQPIETAKNGGAADYEDVVIFPSLNFEALHLENASQKTFYYVVKEQIPDDADKKGISYDESIFQVAITVKNGGNNELVADKVIIKVTPSENGPIATTIKTGEIVFNNGYTTKDAKLTLGGSKTFANKNLKGEDFSFQLYETDETYAIEGVAASQTVKNGADGKYSFEELTFDKVGKYYYVVKEAAGDDAGTADGQVDYDANEYRIEVEVYDNINGELEMNVTYGDIKLTQQNSATIDQLNFANSYNPNNALLNLAGKKILEGREAVQGEFTFGLYETDKDYKVAKDAQPLQTKVNGVENTFAFDTIVYDTLGTHESATYYYVVKELIPEETNGVTYDKTEYKIKAVVKNDGEGKLTVSVDDETFTETAEVNDLDFNNIYTAPPTDDEIKTGDNMKVMLLAIVAMMALIIAVFVLVGRKK